MNRLNTDLLPIADNDTALDQEIRETLALGGLSAKDRLKVAAKLARWSEQLVQSAVQMDPKLKPNKFIKVNLSSHDHKRLRIAAKTLGGELRGYIKYNLHDLICELEEQVKLQRVLGMNGIEQYKFFAVRSELN